jgi:hypothetical protein
MKLHRTLARTLAICAFAFATVPAPSGAAIIASFDFSYGIGFGGDGNAVNFSPLFTASVNGTPAFTAVPVNGDNVFELSGAALATFATELADGTPDGYGFKLVIDSILDQFSLTLFLSEAVFTGAGNLPGAAIQGVRITLDTLCMQPTLAGGCPFPGPGFVGFGTDRILIEVSDTPFAARVPTPATLALLLAGAFGGIAARRGFARRSNLSE